MADETAKDDKSIMPPPQMILTGQVSSANDQADMERNLSPMNYSEEHIEEHVQKKQRTMETHTPATVESSLSLGSNSGPNTKDCNEIPTDMFEGIMEEFQSSFSMIQGFMHQWHQVDEELVSVLNTLQDQQLAAQNVNESFQHQLNDLHKSVAEIVTAFKP